MSHEPSDPSGHVTELVFDYLEEHLSSEEARAVRAHLAECGECAALFAQAEAWRRDIEERGARHLSTARLLALSEGGETATSDDEASHLAGCAFCRNQLEWAQATLQPPGPGLDEIRDSAARRPIAPSPGQGWAEHLLDRVSRLLPGPRWAWAPVAALGVVCLLFILTPRVDDGSEWTALARLEPIPVQWPRGPEARSEFEGHYRRGLQRYAAGDFVAATTLLARAAELQPSHEAVYLFYGSATLLAGEPAAALPLLRRAVTNTGSPVLVEECNWQLANAHLAAADGRGALILLQGIAAGGGQRSGEAQALLEAIATAGR